MALGAVGGALAGPVYHARSRQVEARADAYALDLTHAPQTVVAMQRRLAVVNIADLAPHPLTVTLFASHPPTTARIAQARAWARTYGLPDPPRLAAAEGRP
jgi:STE24 endopeptidase